MKRVFTLFLFITLIFFDVLGGTYNHTKTVTVGETFELNPVYASGYSTDKALSGYATFPDGDAFAVASTSHSFTIQSFMGVNVTGRYNTYKVTALKAGTYTITGGCTICKELGFSTSGVWVKEREYGYFNMTVTVVDVTSVYIPENVSVSVGDTYTFSPIITDSRATTTLTWQSSQTEVATISEDGVLTAQGIGTTIISCTAHNGVSAQCQVTVSPAMVSSITLSQTEAEMTVGGKLQLEATVLPENAMDKSITWSSSNEDIAWVSSGGKVIAVGPGFCQIKATANDGSGKAASCFVEVTEGGNIRGDVNGDGKVTIEDVVKLIDIILEKE